jgi:hypothetical protein
MLWSMDVDPEVVVQSMFPDFVVGMQWILVQDSTGTSPVDMPHRHVPFCLQRDFSSSHKASLAMMLFWIWQ